LINELSVKVHIEVSSLGLLESASGGAGVTAAQANIINSRSADTVMTSRDDQTQVLAGLIQGNQNISNSGLPVLRSIPVIGKLFGADNNTNDDDQIVLLITPHINRNLALPSAAASTFVSGTANQSNGDMPLLLRDGATIQASPANTAQPVAANRAPVNLLITVNPAQPSFTPSPAPVLAPAQPLSTPSSMSAPAQPLSAPSSMSAPAQPLSAPSSMSAPAQPLSAPSSMPMSAQVSHDAPSSLPPGPNALSNPVPSPSSSMPPPSDFPTPETDSDSSLPPGIRSSPDE